MSNRFFFRKWLRSVDARIFFSYRCMRRRFFDGSIRWFHELFLSHVCHSERLTLCHSEPLFARNSLSSKGVPRKKRLGMTQGQALGMTANTRNDRSIVLTGGRLIDCLNPT